MEAHKFKKTTTHSQVEKNSINFLKNTKMKITKIIGLFLSLTLLFITCDDDTSLQDELKDAPNLTFSKLTVNKQDVTKEQLLQQIKEKEKEGFSIRKITISDPAFAEVKGTAPNFSLTLKKAGTFTITITLQEAGFKDVTIEATIVYIATEALTFDKLTTAKSTLSKDDILKQVKGDKDGFTIKSIAIGDSYKSFAEVQGTAPNFSLTLKKAGDFTATIVLQKDNHKDVTLNASFSGVPEKLTFDKLSTYKKNIPKADILKQVKGGSGYTIKSIVVNQSAFATVGSDLSLTILKEGDFTANITLQKAGYFDVVINNAAFKATSDVLSFSTFKTYKKTLTKNDIFNQVQGNKTGYTFTRIAVTDNSYADVNPTTYSLTLKKEGTFAVTLTLEKADAQKILNGQIEYRPKPTLTFNKLTTSKKAVTQAEINTQIQGAKNGYTIKNITVADSHFATVMGTAGNFSLALKKTGTFSVTITLGKANYFDVTLNASIEGRAENLSFNALSITYTGTPTLNSTAILNQVQGAGRANYTLKSISNISDDSVAQVQGTGNNSSISLKKAGSFTAALVLERNGYFDVTIPAASFTIQKAASKTLGFDNQPIPYQKIINKATLESRITGSDKAGYTIARIFDVTPSDIAELTGAGLHIKKTGAFTARFTLVHAFYGDATVTASVTIRKGNAKNIRFDKLTLPYQKTINKARLEQNLKGEKDGYTLKSISTISDPNVAELSGTGFHIKKLGRFTATLTLTHTLYADATLTGSEFEIIKGTSKTLGFDKLDFLYKSVITKEDIHKQVTGPKAGYTIRAITGLKEVSGKNLMELSGTSIKIKKNTGIFTANIVLQHPNYLDATITGATFERKEHIFVFDEKTGTITGIKKNMKTPRDIVIPDQINGIGVEHIGNNAFASDNPRGSGVPVTVILPKNLKTIGSSAFYSCLGLRDLVIPKTVTSIGSQAFYSCLSLTSLTLPNNLRSIESKTFTQSSLNHITIPDKITSIGDGAFSNCMKLTSIKIPESLTSIGVFAFWNCTSLPSITLPASITTIKQDAFRDCTKLTVIIKQSDPSKITLHKDVFDYVQRIMVSSSSVATYKGATTWSKWKNKIFAISTTKFSFKRLTVSNKTLITAEDILAQVTELSGVPLENGYTLKAISGLQEITGGPGLVELSGLSIKIKKNTGIFTANIVLQHPNYLDVTITGATFEKKEQIIFVFDEKTGTITDIKKNVKTPRDIVIPDQINGIEVEHIGNNAFASDNPRGSGVPVTVILPKNLKTIGSSAFYSCLGLRDLVIPKTVTSIGSQAFYSCLSLTSLTLPNNLRSIESKTFTQSSLNHITIPDKITSIGDGAFSNCMKLTSIKIPESLTSIGVFAFWNCTSLPSITLPASITTIKQDAFRDCTKLTVIIKQSDPSKITLHKDVFDYVQRIMVSSSSVATYKGATTWSKWKNKIFAISTTKFSFKRLTVSNKTLITAEDILAQVTELSGVPLENGYTLKAISGLQEITGGPGLVELSGLSIKIKKNTGIFTANIVLQHPNYLDVTITGATFEKKEQIIFVFDEKTGTITDIKKNVKTPRDIVIPDQINGIGVEHIGNNAFASDNPRGSGVPVTVILPKNLKTIGSSAFYSCLGLRDLVIPKTVTSIGSQAFYSCLSLTSLTLPNNLRSIESKTFTQSSLNHITIPDKITSIGDGAFSNCMKLTSIKIPESLTSIGVFAFWNCTSLPSITLPASITTIKQDAFRDCTKLTVIIKQSDPSKITLHKDVFDYVQRIMVSSSSVATYKGATTWSKWKNKIFAISTTKFSFKRLTVSNKTLITAEDILAQVTELSGVPLENGYTLKAISGLQEITGGPGLVELSGLSIKIKKNTGIFTANIVLQHPNYLDVTITGATFEKKEQIIFVFDEKN